MSSKLCQSGLDDAERDRWDVAVEGAQASCGEEWREGGKE